MKRSFNKKGFTLVECVIAIAVFAIMSSMVMLIMTSAVTTARDASQGEKQLNQLVEAVEDSETVYRYNDESKELQMKFDGNDVNYSITYNTSTGYKDFITCPYCDYCGNFKEFLFRIPKANQYVAFGRVYHDYPLLRATNFFYPAGAYNNQKLYYYPKFTTGKDTAGNDILVVEDGNGVANGSAPFNGEIEGVKLDWGQGEVTNFFCPACNNPLVYKDATDWNCRRYSGDPDPKNTFTNVKAAYYFRCYDCDNVNSPYTDRPTESKNENKGFHYNRATGTFQCNVCKGYNVMEQHAHDTLGISSDLVINGIYPNAIITDPVKQPTDDECKLLITVYKMNNVDIYNGACKVTRFSVDKAPNGIDDVYIMQFYSADQYVTYKMKLPPGYTILPANGDTSDLSNIITRQCSTNDSKAEFDEKTNTLTITRASNLMSLAFTLQNKKSGNSFDVDYASQGGLFGYWFRVYDTEEGKGISQFAIPRAKFEKHVTE